MLKKGKSEILNLKDTKTKTNLKKISSNTTGIPVDFTISRIEKVNSGPTPSPGINVTFNFAGASAVDA